MLKSAVRLTTPLARLSTSAVRRGGPKRIKELQEMMQVPNGLPVHLKRGIVDLALYQFTLGLCAFGVGYTAFTIYEMAFPKKV